MMKVCVYILSSVKGVAYTILLQAQIKKVVLSGKFKDLRKPGYGDRDLNCEILSMFIFAYTVQS